MIRSGGAHGELREVVSEEDEALADLVRAMYTKRAGGDPNRTRMAFLLVVTVPSHREVEDVERDLLHSIEFGQPVLSILSDGPAPLPAASG